jgi:hypothetical protein
VLLVYFACAGAIPLLAGYGFTRLRAVKHLFARRVDRVGADSEGLWWAGRVGHTGWRGRRSSRCGYAVGPSW